MKLDQNDFRHLDGKFYGEKVPAFSVDYFGHKPGNFARYHGSCGGYINLSNERRDFLHMGHLSKKFNAIEWLKAHQSEISLLVVEDPIAELNDVLPQFIVTNTWEFYKEVASYVRARFGGQVVSITGSVGKSTTRLMTKKLLEETHTKVLSNFWNDNTRQTIPQLITSLLTVPDVLVAEVSINALNSRDHGPISPLLKTDVAIITQIGGAHLEDLKNKSDPTMFLAERKTRIFQGMSQDGMAIINRDMEPRIYRYTRRRALEKVRVVHTFSFSDSQADAYVLATQDFRDHTELTLKVMGEVVKINLSMPGKGVIMDLLASCLAVKSLKRSLPQDLSHSFTDFQALNSELKFERVKTPNGMITVVDDTHGSTLHSVENVISVFSERGSFYEGDKVLVMETGEDLGDQAATYNLKFKDGIIASGIDTFIGYRDAYIQPLERALSTEIKTDFYQNLSPVMSAIEQLPNDSLVIVKSSDGRKYGSDLWTLPAELEKQNKQQNTIHE